MSKLYLKIKNNAGRCKYIYRIEFDNVEQNAHGSRKVFERRTIEEVIIWGLSRKKAG